MSFTEDTLTTFMATELGATGRALSLTDGSEEILGAVAWVAGILGGSIASQTDDLKTMTVATWRAWVAAKAASAKDVDLKAGSAAIEQSARFEHIAQMLADAETAASRYEEVQAVLAGSYGTAYVSSVSTAGSPYSYASDEWASE